jgi:hypothetical protein
MNGSAEGATMQAANCEPTFAISKSIWSAKVRRTPRCAPIWPIFVATLRPLRTAPPFPRLDCPDPESGLGFA